MKTMQPSPLKRGDTIGIFAPSSKVDKDALEKSVVMLEKRGYGVFIHPQTYAVDHQSAGTGAQKAAAFHDLIKGRDIKAIFAARGGNRSTTMLEHLDFKLIKKNPKILMGYSDITMLLNSIYKMTGIVTYHGPMSHGLISLPQKQIDQCFDILSGKKFTLDMPKSIVLKSGKASGVLLGGNLSVLCGLMGTKYQPDFKGAILFIEDVAEEMSRIDRNLMHLRNAGVMGQIRGLVAGSFTNITDTGKTKYGFKLNDCILNATEGYKIPVLINAPFGHGKDLFTLPVGQPARLQGKTIKFA